ncbi:MAG: FAD:protein FMN transferase [Actinomycetales bacterium]|nr:FAD:protein FMN transferase [Candidatus Lutibacillus vidarii]
MDTTSAASSTTSTTGTTTVDTTSRLHRLQQRCRPGHRQQRHGPSADQRVMMSAHQEWSRCSSDHAPGHPPRPRTCPPPRDRRRGPRRQSRLAPAGFRPGRRDPPDPAPAPRSVSQTLTKYTRAALDAARVTGRAVDHRRLHARVDLGYDRDIDARSARGQARVEIAMTATTWRDIPLDEATGPSPFPGVVLDLGATAKAWAADRCAQAVAMELGIAVLVSLGGDVATVGPTPARWPAPPPRRWAGTSWSATGTDPAP